METIATSGDGATSQGGATNQGEAPRFGAGRPTFGLVKDQGKRLEIAFALKNGGLLTVTEETGDDLTEERVKEFSEQLAKDVAGGATRTFADAWNASGQRAWINLGEVVAFSVRPAK
ncbi:MAG: hypothetical protein M3O34_09615 [Chloroflexota bacterium]|nr:hypothetical protein [Chloroflexota bacterium]